MSHQNRALETKDQVDEHYAQFKSSLKLLKITPSSTANTLYVMSSFQVNATHVYSHLFEGSMPKHIATAVDTRIKSITTEGMTEEKWKSVLAVLSKGSLGNKTVADTPEFLTKHPKMKLMNDALCRVPGQSELIKTRWTPLFVAKAYLTLYQQNFARLWKSAVGFNKYDSLVAMDQFKKENPEIDNNEFVSVISTLRQ